MNPIPLSTTGPPVACTLVADGGDLATRLDQWRTVLGRATGREQTAAGVAVTFPHDVAGTGELAVLMAAEYACCSFASYHLTIDGAGVRMEVRTLPEARDALATMLGAAP